MSMRARSFFRSRSRAWRGSFSPAPPATRCCSAALRAGLGFPHECTSGACGTCRFRCSPAGLRCRHGRTRRALRRATATKATACSAAGPTPRAWPHQGEAGPGGLPLPWRRAAATVRFLEGPRAVTPTMSEFAFASQGDGG